MLNELQPWEKLSFDDLANWVNEMILHDFTGLLNVLYRLDVSEAKIRSLLDQMQNEDAGKIIAAIIIERQIQKKKSREQNKKNLDIPDEYRW
jgi:hypothetical protein